MELQIPTSVSSNGRQPYPDPSQTPQRPPEQLRDRLIVSGLRYYGYTGFDEAERALGQWFEVDFELWADLRPSAMSGQLCDTLDYRSAVAGIAELVRSNQFVLIESLAEAIAEMVLRETGASKAKIRLTKCHPPIPDLTGRVTLEIVRP
ncbi:dihydroneopterin aldolase [Synechococcus sp. Nb3U1]|uniref:dihydroneopterin aldolase n=1 Tax=Synechococcus sp. Nb3U1 TaxID=1914529 RepID=UPI001F345FE9|nr:dihydroneopterin aldolase [Synechococcus sp. Nb3U1]MCF2972467.1 dihydroneopterin aldolase [Synechococcus sp. Nb3U1]